MNFNSIFKLPAYTLLLVLLFSCDGLDPTSYSEKLVVYGKLSAGQPFTDTISVALTADITDGWNIDREVCAARVSIWDGQTAPVCLTPVPGQPGKYIDQSWAPHLVTPATQYTLTVNWGNYHVEALTTVPDTVAIHSIRSSGWYCSESEFVVEPVQLNQERNSDYEIDLALGTGEFHFLKMDTVYYHADDCHTSDYSSPPLLVLKWAAEKLDWSHIAITTVQALDTSATKCIIDTSTAANTFKGSMYRDSAGNLRRNAVCTWQSGSGLIPVNWINFNYYGPQLITVEFANASLHDYLEGNTTDNPFTQPTSNIAGGYGLFYATFSRRFVVYLAPGDED